MWVRIINQLSKIIQKEKPNQSLTFFNTILGIKEYSQVNDIRTITCLLYFAYF